MGKGNGKDDVHVKDFHLDSGLKLSEISIMLGVWEKEMEKQNENECIWFLVLLEKTSDTSRFQFL